MRNSKHRVFYIDPMSYSNMSIYDYSLLSGMKTDAFDLYYFCSKCYDYKPLCNAKKVIKCFAYNKISNSVLKVFSYACSYFMIFLYILALRPKVIHVQWLRVPKSDYLFFLITKKLFGYKFVLTAHNITPHDTNDRFMEIYGKIYNIADCLIVHTEDTSLKLSSMFNISMDKINVIEHGILRQLIEFKKLDSLKEELERKYKVKGKMVFSSLGMQNYYKGTDIIADVWRNTPELRNNNGLVLIMAGKQNNVDLSILADIENVVIENSRISDEEFYFLLKNTDVYLLPYRDISQSGALLTALSTHTPVLVSDIGGLSEPLKYANIGWKIPKADYADLKDALLYLVSHKSEVDQIKDDEDSWDKIENHYDWSRISALTENLYKKLLKD